MNSSRKASSVPEIDGRDLSAEREGIDLGD